MAASRSPRAAEDRARSRRTYISSNMFRPRSRPRLPRRSFLLGDAGPRARSLPASAARQAENALDEADENVARQEPHEHERRAGLQTDDRARADGERDQQEGARVETQI